MAFLDELVRQFPTGTLYLALDNAPIHTAKVVQRWLAAHPRVQALWLPKYGAHDVNPAERIWGFLKTDVAANRLAGTMAALVEAARRCFHGLPRYPVALPQPQPALAEARSGYRLPRRGDPVIAPWDSPPCGCLHCTAALCRLQRCLPGVFAQRCCPAFCGASTGPSWRPSATVGCP